MAAIIPVEVTNAGGTHTFDASTMADGTIIYLWASSGITLAADFKVEFSANPSPGNTVIIQNQVPDVGVVDLNGFTFRLLGNTIDTFRVNQLFKYIAMSDDLGAVTQYMFIDLRGGNCIDGTMISGNIPFTALNPLTSGNILVGNGSNVATSVAMSGDATLANTGALTIANSAITNAKVAAAAAIARSKTAAGTADYVVINSNTGVMTEEAQLAPVRGGTGQDTSASTGFPVVASGTWSVSTLTEYKRVDISFVTAAQGTYYVKVPAGTITSAKARVTSTISGTDDGTITIKDASGTNMTGGLLTIPASSAHGTGVAVTITANNTATAGQEIQLLVAKTTSGGTCSVELTITRTGLT